ncbi:hypothetical protein ACIQ1J_15000 [Streptomyces sp. NPDC097107]|uniref:hypothetical protein n=1 Tax=Streptomyces sp. NPDC097107 TaxID=3366089 RepID=UPI00380F8CB8
MHRRRRPLPLGRDLVLVRLGEAVEGLDDERPSRPRPSPPTAGAVTPSDADVRDAFESVVKR